MLLEEGETLEDLQLNGLSLIQKKDSFRFGMDSVLLAHYADIRDTDTVADFGTGNGVLILLLRGRNKGKRYYAFDIQDEAVKLAERNMILNHINHISTVIHADAGDAAKFIPSCSLDAIICNPPYGHFSAVLASPNEMKATARKQNKDTLDRLLAGAFAVLKGKGRIYLIYPASQMLHIMIKLHEYHLEPKRFRLVYPFTDKPANLVLLEAVKDARPTLHPLPPLIIRNSDGSLTNELKSVYHIQEQTVFYK